jgi:GcrA cell cycle regulator
MGGHVNEVWRDLWSAALKDKLSRGFSYSRIAAEINDQFNTNFSRNAACGKGYRMGLAAPPKMKVPRKKRKRDRERAPTIKPRPRIEEIQLRCAEIEPRHLTLDQLEPDDCRYPFGEGPFTFCGRLNADGSSYCEEHFLLSTTHTRSNSDAVTEARARRMRGINFRRSLLEEK